MISTTSDNEWYNEWKGVVQRRKANEIDFRFQNETITQRLKWKFCLCWSIDLYDTDSGGQATYHDDQKIVFSLWRKWIREAATGGAL